MIETQLFKVYVCNKNQIECCISQKHYLCVEHHMKDKSGKVNENNIVKMFTIAIECDREDIVKFILNISFKDQTTISIGVIFSSLFKIFVEKAIPKDDIKWFNIYEVYFVNPINDWYQKNKQNIPNTFPAGNDDSIIYILTEPDGEIQENNTRRLGLFRKNSYLYTACQQNATKCAISFIREGYDPYFKIDINGQNGKNCFHISFLNENIAICDEMISKYPEIWKSLTNNGYFCGEMTLSNGKHRMLSWLFDKVSIDNVYEYYKTICKNRSFILNLSNEYHHSFPFTKFFSLQERHYWMSRNVWKYYPSSEVIECEVRRGYELFDFVSSVREFFPHFISNNSVGQLLSTNSREKHHGIKKKSSFSIFNKIACFDFYYSNEIGRGEGVRKEVMKNIMISFKKNGIIKSHDNPGVGVVDYFEEYSGRDYFLSKKKNTSQQELKQLEEKTFRKSILYQIFGVFLAIMLLQGEKTIFSFPKFMFNFTTKTNTNDVGVNMNDLCQIDNELHKSLCVDLFNMNNRDISDMFLSFSTINSHGNLVEFVRNGSKKSVTKANLWDYVNKYSQYVIEESRDFAVLSFQMGFNSVLPRELTKKLFLPNEIHNMLSITNKEKLDNELFDMKKFKSMIRYEINTKKNDDDINIQGKQIIRWLVDVFDEEFTNQEKSLFLQFWSGHGCLELIENILESNQTRKNAILVPFDEDIISSDDISRDILSIRKDILKIVVIESSRDDSYYMTSSTCSKQLRVPFYSSKEKLKEKMFSIIEQQKSNSLGFHFV